MKYIIDSYAWVEYFLGSRKGQKLVELFNRDNEFYTVICCFGEIQAWAVQNKIDFSKLLPIIRTNSKIVNLTEEEWILAGIRRQEQRLQKHDFGLIDATILVKREGLDCWIITGDKHFKDLTKIVYLE